MEYLVFDANVTQRWRRVKEFVDSCTDAAFWVDIKRHTRSLLKDTIELTMLDEIKQYLGTQKHQRAENPIDWRNGYYYRSLDTELGPLTDIKVPRSRRGLFKTNTFQRYNKETTGCKRSDMQCILSRVSQPEMYQAL
jgi:transposase-like protein